MSVAYMSCRDFGALVAIASRLNLGDLDELAAGAETLSVSNCAAIRAQYSESMTPVTAAEIAGAARIYLESEVPLHFGPVVYNCITNAGEYYYGDLPATVAGVKALEDWRSIEEQAREWAEQQARAQRRAEENAVAFNDVGQLPVQSAETLKAAIGETGALIIAEFRVDESESQSDYYGGRTARRVVIGIRKASRTSFKALRKAAAAFPPTAEYGPGLDEWTVSAWRQPTRENGYRERQSLTGDNGRWMVFPTEAAARKYVENLIATSPECQPGYTGCIGFPSFAKEHGFEVHSESLEHRENYSMGGGNYLGRSRYSGWKVSDTRYITNAMEVFSLARF